MDRLLSFLRELPLRLWCPTGHRWGVLRSIPGGVVDGFVGGCRQGRFYDVTCVRCGLCSRHFWEAKRWAFVEQEPPTYPPTAQATRLI